MPELGTTPAGTVQINGKLYVLEILNGEAVFSSGTRAIQGAPTDDFHMNIPFGSRGVGRSFYTANNVFTVVPNVLMPPPKRTTLTLTGLFTAPLRYDFEEQDANGRWYKYFVGPQAIVKIDITSNPPVVRQVYRLTDIAAFASTDRLGQPVKLTSAGTNYIYIPCNSGDRIVKLTTPVGVETTSAAYNPVVTLNGEISAAATSLVYTSTGDPVAAGDILLIGTEEIRVGAIDTGTNTCSSLTRGWAGTTAAIHVDTSAITKKGGLDVYAAITSVVKGAAHLEQAIDARVYRATSSHTTGTFQNRAEISILTASANPDTDANWGDDFPQGSQVRWITALQAYQDQMLIKKQDGWGTSVLQSDNTLRFQSVLPEDRLTEIVALGSETTHRGTNWHGAALLPAGGFWRSYITAALPVDPDSIPTNDTLDIFTIGYPVKLGRIPTAIGIGSWLYAPYPAIYTAGAYFCFLLAAKENAEGTLDWWPLYRDAMTSGVGAQLASVQINGVGAPRIFYSIDGLIYHFPVAQNGDPAVLDDVASWDTQLAGSWVSNSIRWDSNVLLREMEYVIDGGDQGFKWGLKIYRNGGSAQTILAAGSGLAATGSIFWTPGTSDTLRRLRIEITNNGAALAAPTSPSKIHAAILHGIYLPDVSDEMQFVINVPATAALRGMSEKGVYDEARALVSAGAKTWVDLYGQSGYVAVRATREEAPPSMHPLIGRPVVTVSCTLLEYA